MTPDYKIAFKPLEMSDLPLIHTWVNLPHVREGYSRGVHTMEDVIEDYSPHILEAHGIFGYVICFNNVPVGYIQKYKLTFEDYFGEVEWEHGAGIDVFIGEPEVLGKGVGTQVIGKFFCEQVFNDNEISHCVINPRQDNSRAIRVYEKLGFKHLKTVQVLDFAPECLMRLDRQELRYARGEGPIQHAGLNTGA